MSQFHRMRRGRDFTACAWLDDSTGHWMVKINNELPTTHESKAACSVEIESVYADIQKAIADEDFTGMHR